MDLTGLTEAGWVGGWGGVEDGRGEGYTQEAEGGGRKEEEVAKGKKRKKMLVAMLADMRLSDTRPGGRGVCV